MSDVFDTAKEETEINYLAKMTDKDERFTDPEFMAKKAFNGEAHISKIEQENEALREQLGKSQTASDVLAQLKEEIRESRNSQFTPGQENTTPTPEEKPDIAALVREQMASLNTENMAQANKEKAIGDLANTVGADNVAAVIGKKAKELGVSTDYLRDVASKSPIAFQSFFPSTSGSAPSPTTGGVNTEALNNAKPSDTQGLQTRKAEMRSMPMAKRNKAWRDEMLGINAQLN